MHAVDILLQILKEERATSDTVITAGHIRALYARLVDEANRNADILHDIDATDAGQS